MRLNDIDPDDQRLLTDVFPVLTELRARLTPKELVDIYKQGYGQGLRFLAAYDDGYCVGVAGWRVLRCTSANRKLYIDDLVTAETERSKGVGSVLVDELERRAVAAGCTSMELDSGIQRAVAHRFYFRERFSISSFHFKKRLL